jgi:hypothetical protein
MMYLSKKRAEVRNAVPTIGRYREFPRSRRPAVCTKNQILQYW